MAKKIRYNYDLLKNIIDKNNVELTEDYKEQKLTRDTIIKGKCISNDCNSIFSKTLRLLNDNAGPYCVTCSRKIGHEKLKNTCLENYGVDHPTKSKDVIKKRDETNLKKYGVKCSLRGKEAIEKTKQTNIKLYGVENVSQSKEIWDKIKNSNKEKYGTDYGFQSEIVKKKIEETNINRYGGIRPSSDSEIKEKVKQTNLERYGVENVSKNPEFMDKISKKCYNRRTFTSKSGKEYICQGYEPYALKILTEDQNISDDNIITGVTNVPKIKYLDNEDSEHIHYPDIYLKAQNKIIEVKSSWTLKKKEDSVFAKQKAAKEQGFQYEIWVMSPKGLILEKHT